jgi:predicted ATPase
MKRYILTGTPGSGKTSLLHELKRQGYWVVEEAATDVIAREQGLGNSEPWLQADFIDSIVRLQKQRQLEASTSPDELQWYDRSPICTLALSHYLGYPGPSMRKKVGAGDYQGGFPINILVCHYRREKSPLRKLSCSRKSMKKPTPLWATTC